jgi:hypothetical protein
VRHEDENEWWLPYSDVRAIYGITKEHLAKVVAEGHVRTNPIITQYGEFTGYSESDLEDWWDTEMENKPRVKQGSFDGVL